MKIAIHNRPGSFSDHWIKYCRHNDISYKIVDCYNSDIISQMNDCEGLMWHWSHGDSKAVHFAYQLIRSLEQAGKKVYPDSRTCWHFDDKLGQKYLFEAMGISSVPTWVFYDKQSAYKWIKKKQFPIVFKLRGGAGSQNVKLVKTSGEAKRIVRKAFSKGFEAKNKWNDFKDRLLRLKREKSLDSVFHVLKGIVRLFVRKQNERMLSRDRGYVYFQDFIPGNTYDTRLIVIGDRCFGLRRYCRNDDFRASGSGNFVFDPGLIDKKMIEMSFDVASKLKTQSVALDFLLDNNNIKITEISYCFAMNVVLKDCPGYWDTELNWHIQHVNPAIFVIEDFLRSFKGATIKDNIMVAQ